MKTLIKILCLSMLWFSCEETTKHGCLDSEACNYDPNANLDNNSCIYLEDKIEQGYCSCDDVDGDEDGICDDVDLCLNDPFNLCSEYLLSINNCGYSDESVYNIYFETNGTGGLLDDDGDTLLFDWGSNRQVYFNSSDYAFCSEYYTQEQLFSCDFWINTYVNDEFTFEVFFCFDRSPAISTDTSIFYNPEGPAGASLGIENTYTHILNANISINNNVNLQNKRTLKNTFPPKHK